MHLDELKNAVVVVREMLDSDEPYDLVQSNINVINFCLNRHLRGEELSDAANQSYYVDYYLAQVKNGGFSQFVYNSRWNPEVIDLVDGGLSAMGAREHAALFREARQVVDGLTQEQLQAYLSSEYFGENAARDFLNQVNDRFFEIDESEDLVTLNHDWLSDHPQLRPIAGASIQEELEEALAEIPDLAARQEAALDAEPRYTKLIRRLCDAAGKTFQTVTAGDPSHEHDGETILAWHFLTDTAHFYMLDFGEEAAMYDDDDQEVARIDATGVA